MFDRSRGGETRAISALRFPGQPVLLEHFLPGREFNVSLLAGPRGVEALPVAEIAFVDFPPGVPALVGYEAKWASGSFEETHTVRQFPGGADAPLLAQIRELALACWDPCGLAGYARVGFGLDESGAPAILEVNTNPCLSADAGFMAAAARGGLTAADVVGRTWRRPRPAELRSTGGTLGMQRTPWWRTREHSHRLAPEDRTPLEKLLRDTGFFNPQELEVALELVDDRLPRREEPLPVPGS